MYRCTPGDWPLRQTWRPHSEKVVRLIFREVGLSRWRKLTGEWAAFMRWFPFFICMVVLLWNERKLFHQFKFANRSSALVQTWNSYVLCYLFIGGKKRVSKRGVGDPAGMSVMVFPRNRHDSRGAKHRVVHELHFAVHRFIFPRGRCT